jgi:hypothetical protein
MSMTEDILGRVLEGFGKGFDDLSGELTGAFNEIVSFRETNFRAQRARENVQISNECGSNPEGEMHLMDRQLDYLDTLGKMMQVQLKPKYQLACSFLGLDPDSLNASIDRTLYQVALEGYGVRLG